MTGDSARRPAGPLRRRYFSVVALLLLALTLIGFLDNLVTNVGQRSNGDPKFIIHGLFCLAWMVIFAVQANLVRTRNVRLHRRLGVVGFFIAIGVTLSTLTLFAMLGKPWDAMAPEIRMNRMLLPGYAIMVLLAVRHRRHSDLHKRLLLMASFFMLEPVLSRAFDPFDPWLLTFTDAQVDRAWWIFFIGMWNGLFLSLFAYDWITDRRIHRVTMVGMFSFYAMWGIALTT